MLLGRVAAEGVLQRKLAVVSERGKVIHQEKGIKYFLTVHPAAALRFPNKFKHLLKEMTVFGLKNTDRVISFGLALTHSKDNAFIKVHKMTATVNKSGIMMPVFKMKNGIIQTIFASKNE